jgi:predicted transcriptional regulator
MRTRIQAKAEANKKKAEQLNEELPLTEDEKMVGENILKSSKLFHDILRMVKKLGVVGEEKNVLLHYLILTSRKLKQPLSATVKGDSSSGKSYTLLTTIKMFPKSAYIELTDATPQSFYYCSEDYFKHRIVIIFEKHGGERSDYTIRTLQSEGKLKIQVTLKNPETNQFETKMIEKEGPTGFITTTTKSYIHAENDTRNISMFPDQSSEQTGRIYESVDSRYLGVKPISDNELKPWHYAQRVLEQLPVHIPFVKSFRKYFPRNIIRTRRDYGHFLAILETVTFLHQKQRERIELDGQKFIRATLADAYIAKVIVEDSLSKSIYELPEKTVELIEVASALLDETNEKQFTITELAKKVGWDRDTVANWLKPAGKKGYITMVEESKGSKGAEYIVEEKELPGDSFLPSVNDLVTDNPNESTDNIYDPITGEPVITKVEPKPPCTDAPIGLGEIENTHIDRLNEFADECISSASE